MSSPVNVKLPHRLGAEEAKRRIAANMSGLTAHLPPGAEVGSSWHGDRLALDVGLLGQRVEASIDVQETLVEVTVLLPPALAVFGKAVAAALRRSAPTLLEDRTKRG
jgi:hypothetical protein